MRAVARRRLEQRESAKRMASRSRRERVRTLAVCAGALLLMALGLYFGLAHQENAAPVESAAHQGTVRTV